MKSVNINKSLKINYLFTCLFIIGYMVSYWLIDSVLDVWLFNECTFVESFFHPDPMCLSMRLINVPIILACLLAAQWMYTKRKTAEEEIKTLRGIIPICASCKNIRDDKGYWKKVEIYIEEHSQAEFSHGICQECRKKLYPNLVDENENFVDS